MNQLVRDLRQGIRMLRRNSGFTAVALLSLALGIGANTAIFSLVNAVLLRPLPFSQPERLAVVWEDASFVGFPHNTPAPANYWDWKNQNHTFKDMAAISDKNFNLTGMGEPERVAAESVTANFFPLLGVSPLIGRTFSQEEDREGPNKVVVLSYGLWQRRFGREKDVVGKEILLNGQKYSVIGVMPARFQFIEKDVGLWVPMAFGPQDLANRSAHFLTVFGRLKDGVTIDQAQADIKTIMSRISRDHPDEAAQLGAYVIPLREEVSGDVRRPLIVLLAAVGFVLLIACANIANLLLSMSASRKKEIAIRTALGAGRLRVARQLITESLLLACSGGLIGLLVASWCFGFLQRLIPDSLSLLTSLKLDTPVLLYTLLISLLTGLIFGAAPALQAGKTDLTEALKANSGRGGFGGNRKLRSIMVVAEVALALMLLVGAGLLLQTFYRLRSQDIGFRAENVVRLQTILPKSKYSTFSKRIQFYDQVLEQIEGFPNVLTAGYTTTVPLVWKGGTNGFYVEGRAVKTGEVNDATHRIVTSQYLQTMGIPLRAGRYFEKTDTAQSLPVAIVNETMARNYWPNESAIGKRFRIPTEDRVPKWLTIVGIVSDVKNMGIDAPVKQEMYVPVTQSAEDFYYYAPQDLVIRVKSDPLKIVPDVRSVIQKVDPDQPVSNITTMEDILGEEVAQRKLGTTLLTCFAALALLLASLGIYGILSYLVVQSTPEIGVRLALGAKPQTIFGWILKRGMGLALLGICIGLIGAFALTRVMTSLLFGISATDPFTFAIVSAILLSVAFLACSIPGLRAMKVDPVVALRYE